MTPSLYDLLDVDPSADAEEIRAAWKSAIADLDPTDRRFRAYNDAAGVLLDPAKRAEYDAGLAAAAGPDAEPAATAAADPLAAADPPAAAAAEKTPAGTSAGPSSGLSAGPPSWAIGAAAVAAVLCLALAVLLLVQPGGNLFSGEDSPREVVDRSARVERAGVEAESAAERMVPSVLSYDYRTMDADHERSQALMTDGLAAKQAKGWAEITKEAQAQKIVVQASSAASALTRVSEDGDRATVVVFIDQRVTKGKDDPFVLKMWATFSLVHQGESWLLDDLCTDSDCG